MRLDLSFLGWIHSLCCIAALALGGINLARPKGTEVHRRIGQAYLLYRLRNTLNRKFLGGYEC
jgi:uncharacterized membrane protein